VTAAVRLGRGVLGVVLGWAWCSALSLLCLGALAAGYGGLDRGLSLFKDEWWAPIAFAAYFGSVAGSWAGGAVAPVALGPSRLRLPVVASSLAGGAAGGLLAAAPGALAGWLVWRESPQSMLVVQLPLILGVPLGLLAGWVAGRTATEAQPVAANVTMAGQE
jgi:hypothetical protein